MSNAWNYPSSREQNRLEFHEMYKSLTDPNHEGNIQQKLARTRAERERENEEDAGLL